MRSLQLKQAVQTSQTPSGNDLLEPTLGNGVVGIHFTSAVNTVSDLPEVVFGIYKICDCSALLNSPLYALTGIQLRSLDRFVISVSVSPCFTKLFIASVYQNYADATDVNNTFVTVDGIDVINPLLAANGYNVDVLLETLSIAKDYKSVTLITNTIISIYYGSQVFRSSWTLEDVIALTYVFGTTNTATSAFVLELRSPSDLVVIAQTLTDLSCERYVCFRLACDHTLYVVGSGAAGDFNPIPVETDPVIPSELVVFRVDAKSKSIIRVVSEDIAAASTWLDIKVCDNRVLILNLTKLPLSTYPAIYFDTPIGTQAPFYPDTEGSSAQVFSFTGECLELLTSAVTNVGSSRASGFIPNTDNFIVGTLHDPGFFDNLAIFNIEGRVLSSNTPVPTEASISLYCRLLAVGALNTFMLFEVKK